MNLSPQQTGAGRTGGALYTVTTGTPLVVYIDARAAQVVHASSDADPFGVDPRAAQQVS
jgi:DNA-binding beta-propeller fold protein YncE